MELTPTSRTVPCSSNIYTETKKEEQIASEKAFEKDKLKKNYLTKLLEYFENKEIPEQLFKNRVPDYVEKMQR